MAETYAQPVSDEEAELTSQIRRLIALLVKQHVRGWYSSISQDEQLFAYCQELTSQIHITLSGRVEAVDWHRFFLLQLPEILSRHLEDFNLAKDRSRQSFSLEASFFKLQHHPGIEDQQSYLDNVADALLVVLLSENDLMSDLAYGFLRDLLSDLVFATVLERLSEPWFWDEVLIKVREQLTQEYIHYDWRSKIWTAYESITSRFVSSIKTSLEYNSGKQSDSRNGKSLLQAVHSLAVLFLNPLSGRMHKSSLYSTSIPKIVKELLRPSDWPFLKALLQSLILPLVDIISGENIMQSIHTTLETRLSHASLANMTRLARNVLFPDDKPSPNRVIPDVRQQAALHLKMQSILPPGINIPFFESKEINKVLLYQILDALMGTIFPELQRRSPEQLKQKVIRIRQANIEAAGDGGIKTGISPNPAYPSPMENTTKAQDSAAIARAEKNLRDFEAEQHGIQALHAMRRSFELKRGKDLKFSSTLH